MATHHQWNQRKWDAALLSAEHQKCFTEPRECEHGTDADDPPVRGTKRLT